MRYPSKRILSRWSYADLTNWFDKHYTVSVFTAICQVIRDKRNRPGNTEDMLRAAVYMSSTTRQPPDPVSLIRLIQWGIANKYPSLMDIPDSLMLAAYSGGITIDPPPQPTESTIGGTLYTGVNDNYFGA